MQRNKTIHLSGQQNKSHVLTFLLCSKQQDGDAQAYKGHFKSRFLAIRSSGRHIVKRFADRGEDVSQNVMARFADQREDRSVSPVTSFADRQGEGSQSAVAKSADRRRDGS